MVPVDAYGNQEVSGGITGACTGHVSGDVSPIHRFLGTDGVCVRGAVGVATQEGANHSLCRVLGAMWRRKMSLTCHTCIDDDEQGGLTGLTVGNC